MAIPNKLKRLDGYHGRLFLDDEIADMYRTRMTNKLGPGWEMHKQTVNIDGKQQILVYAHHKELDDA